MNLGELATGWNRENITVDCLLYHDMNEMIQYVAFRHAITV
jgi:hypothetical protein